jgi:hypothetical protein
VCGVGGTRERELLSALEECGVSANLSRTRALSEHSHDKTKFLWVPRRCFAGHHLGAGRSGAPALEQLRAGAVAWVA